MNLKRILAELLMNSFMVLELFLAVDCLFAFHLHKSQQVPIGIQFSSLQARFFLSVAVFMRLGIISCNFIVPQQKYYTFINQQAVQYVSISIIFYKNSDMVRKVKIFTYVFSLVTKT